MSHNNPPSSFFNNPDPDDNADTQIDEPGDPQYRAYPPTASGPYQQPPNYGQPNPNAGYGPQSGYSQLPYYGQGHQSHPPASHYGPDHSEQPTNLGGPASNSQPYYGSPNYGPQSSYDMPPTQIPNQGYQSGWQDPISETRLDVGEQPQGIQPLGLLIVKRPLERRGYAHHVRGSCTIGRRAGNILLAADDLVSEYHANIRLGEPVDGEPAFWIADMNSRNGTKVNGVKIDGRYRLKNGDEISIGRSIFVFMMLKD
jgi:hypothetical protein